jgi:hypothetical protein
MAGALGIGSTNLTGVNLRVGKTLTGATLARGIYITGVVQSDVTNNAVYFSTDAQTQAAAFTLTTLTHFQAAVPGSAFGVGSTVTTQIGFNVNSSLTGATNNYGFRGQIASGTGRWNIYMDGTANNYMAGETYIGGTTDQGAYNLQVNGTGVWGAGAYVNGSDSRLKNNILEIGPALDLVNKLKPVTYKYNEDYSKDQSIQSGFIAQDLQDIFKDESYVEGLVIQGPKYLSVAYQNLIPILVKAIQEQQVQIEELKAKLK